MKQQTLSLGKTVPGINVDPKEVATKVSKYTTDSYTERFHLEIMQENYKYTNHCCILQFAFEESLSDP